MRNRKIILLLLAVLLCGVGILSINKDASFAANQSGVVTVTANRLNIRTGAGKNYDILKSDGVSVQLENGTKVTVLESQSGWYKVSFTFNGKALTGYASSQYIAIEKAATPAPTMQTSVKTTYRYETSYKKIQVPAKIKKKTKVYKKAGGKQLKVSKKAVTLAAKKKIKITGEKTVKGKKWFKISFTYKKKTRTGYVRELYVKMTLKPKANAAITNLKPSVKVRTKANTKAAYKKVSGKAVKLAKGTTVEIGKEKIVKGKKWYKVYFSYAGKTRSGYLLTKYVKLAKKKVVKKIPVIALNSKEFEKAMTQEGFPETYKKQLRILHQAYPYWQFKAYKTGLDWNTAVANESKLGVNLISNAKSAAWKSMEPGAYDATTGTWKVFDGSTWVAASRTAIAYYMDPRNFLNDRNIFQFEMLEYQSQYQTKTGINAILANTPFYNKSFNYTDIQTGKAKTISYTDAFVAAARESGVSPYHLASRVKQEVVTGSTTTSIAVTGTNSTYPGIFNFYNIGATSGKNPALNGLKWASSGNTYLRPWKDRYRSIVGGGMFIGASYINKGQNTGYLQKFNVTNYQRYDHQYMTNVEAAYSEAIKTKRAYAGIMDKSPIVFSIPVYNNMPASNCPAPR